MMRSFAFAILVASSMASATEAVIDACVNPAGVLRVVSTQAECRSAETAISWSVQGEKGDPGEQLWVFDATGRRLGLLVDGAGDFETGITVLLVDSEIIVHVRRLSSTIQGSFDGVGIGVLRYASSDCTGVPVITTQRVPDRIPAGEKGAGVLYRLGHLPPRYFVMRREPYSAHLIQSTFNGDDCLQHSPGVQFEGGFADEGLPDDPVLSEPVVFPLNIRPLPED